MSAGRRRYGRLWSRHREAWDTPAEDGFDVKAAFTYEMLHLRHLDQERMLWDAPTLSLAAQAFLLTIALGSDTQDFARLVSSALGVLITILAMQLMTKHRFFAESDRRQLRQLEEHLGMTPGIAYSDWAWRRSPGKKDEYALGHQPKLTWPRKRSSYNVWQGGLAIIGLAQLLIFVLVASGSTVLDSPEPTERAPAGVPDQGGPKGPKS